MQNQLSYQRKNIHESTWGWEWPQAKKIHKETIQTQSERSCSFLRHAAPRNPTAPNFIPRTKSVTCGEEWLSQSLRFFPLHSLIQWTCRISRDGSRICRKSTTTYFSSRQMSNSGKNCDMVGSLIKGSFSNPRM